MLPRNMNFWLYRGSPGGRKGVAIGGKETLDVNHVEGLGLRLFLLWFPSEKLPGAQRSHDVAPGFAEMDLPGRVEGLGCRVQGSGCMVQGAGCRVQGALFRIQGAGFGCQGA